MWLLARGQPKREGRASPYTLTGSSEVAAMRFGDGLCDSQTNAQPGFMMLSRFIKSDKQVKYPISLLSIEAGATVGDVDDHVLALQTNAEFNSSRLRSVFRGIC